VRLACEANDQWAIIPTAAATIEPLTPEQQAAMQQKRSYAQQQNSADQAAQARQEARDRARREALNSSSVAPDFAAKTTLTSTLTAPTQPQESHQQNASVPVASNPGESQEAETPRLKYPWDQYTGPLYRVFEGTVIEGVLTNRLNGEFTGPVNVMVSSNLYSHDRQHILIPQGTRILGEAQPVTVNQQRRLAVVFHRAIMPDGYSIDFNKYAGLDQQGATGLT